MHRCRKIRDWLGPRDKQIELFFLPGYAPELNPDELLNATSSAPSARLARAIAIR